MSQADDPMRSIVPDPPATSRSEVDPTSPGVVYAGLFYRGIYKSSDGGESWSMIAGFLPRILSVHAAVV